MDMLNSEDIKAIKDLIAYKNEFKEKFCKLWKYGKPSLINENDVFASNRKMFEFVRNDYEYLYAPFRNKLIRKLAKEMFNNCEITLREYLAYKSMYNPIEI